MSLTKTDSRWTSALAERWARISLDGIEREYPNGVLHVMESDRDALTPRQMKPAFYGCFDWHSAVHNHWALVRMLRSFPDADWTEPLVPALDRRLTAGNIAGELDYIAAPARTGFEMPYGMAWLLQLTAELREWSDDPRAARWLAALRPLEQLARDRFVRWLRRLSVPIRAGEHSQSAFAMGLVLDWCRVAGDDDLRRLAIDKAVAFHAAETDWPFRLEPSAYDFLSPGLASADLLRRVWHGETFTAWLGTFLGAQPLSLAPLACVDSSSGKLSHWEGLNLSRAWMLDGIASACLDAERQAELAALREAHLRAGLTSITGEHYAGAHWLVSFGVYLLTRRGR